MRFELLRASLLGIPLPLRIEACANGYDSYWEFEVTIARIGSYRGVMAPVS